MWPDSETPEARAPADCRLYAIGDVHGCADLLTRLHGLIRDDAAAAPESRKILIYLGDYVDRGPDSAAVIESLISHPLPGFEHVHLKGNHEDFMLRFLADPSDGALWMMNGGAATLTSYGLDADGAGDPRGAGDLRALRERFHDRLPTAHLAFLQGLSLSHIERDYLFVHAGIRPGLPLSRQIEDDLLWIRDPFLTSGEDHGHLVVHGHTPVESPEVLFNRINVDTGAFWTGRLTALVMHGDRHRFIHT